MNIDSTLHYILFRTLFLNYILTTMKGNNTQNDITTKQTFKLNVTQNKIPNKNIAKYSLKTTKYP